MTEDQLTVLVTKARGKFVELRQEPPDGCSMERFIARELLPLYTAHEAGTQERGKKKISPDCPCMNDGGSPRGDCPACRAGTQEPVAWQDIARTLCAVDGHGFLDECDASKREAYKVRAQAVAALYAEPASHDATRAPRQQAKMARMILQKRGMFKTSIDSVEEYQGE